MSVRRQTLSEWFLDHQLRSVEREHFHIPMHLEIDVSALEAHYTTHGERVPVTAVVVRALAIVAERYPHINRTVFRTPLGTRVVDFDHIDVNVPVMMEHEGQLILSAVVVTDANTKSVSEIRDEVRAARKREIQSLPIARLMVNNRNTPLNRTRLRLLHWAVWRLPWLYEHQRGGGLAVSSLVRGHTPGFSGTAVSRGPNAVTLGIWGLESGERTLLRVGVGFDHCAMDGAAFHPALLMLNEVLSRTDLSWLEA